MGIYLVPFTIFALLSIIEAGKYRKLINNKIFYLFIFCIFIVFFGLRDEIGCDWLQYEVNFEYIKNSKLIQIILNPKYFYNIGYSIISKLLSYQFNFNVAIFIFSLLFSGPLFFFCSKLKNPYLTLMLSYPYYILVIGMGPLRQSISISFLMLSIIFIYLNKYKQLYISTILSSIFHFSAIIINGIFLILFNVFNKQKIKKVTKMFFYLILITLLFFNIDLILNKLIIYINEYEGIVNPAKGALFVWILNLFPSLIYIRNTDKFKFNIILKKMVHSFLIFDIFLLPVILFNSVIGYRLILYSLPKSIFISSFLPKLKLFKINEINIIIFLILFSFTSLIIWLKFAYHSYCWIPYKNILF